MMGRRLLVLDANILIRAVLGVRVWELISEHADQVGLVAPEAAVTEARRHLPEILVRRGLEPQPALAVFEELSAFVLRLDADLSADRRADALERIGRRDPADWPALAAALALDCPVWTEDADFFGVGVVTWVTALVEIYLSQSDEEREE
jgi:predicted nucleic acid-binding protein